MEKAKKSAPKKGSKIPAKVQGSPQPNFSYSFERKGTTLLHFEVEDFQQDYPPDSGNFYTPILDPGAIKHIHVTVIARQDIPAGSASVTLQYKGKNVYDPSRDVDFKNGIGGINETVKLP